MVDLGSLRRWRWQAAGYRLSGEPGLVELTQPPMKGKLEACRLVYQFALPVCIILRVTCADYSTV